MKNYTVNYYQVCISDGDEKLQLYDILKDFADMGAGTPVHKPNSYSYKIKQLIIHPGSVQGIFCKFRHDDIPQIGEEDTDEERDIELDDQEGLIEKNHFIYYKAHNLLLYQASKEGSHHAKMEHYITHSTGVTTVFNPVLREDQLERLIKGNYETRKMEISVAAPKDALLSGHQFNRRLKRMMDESRSINFHGTFSIGRSKDDYLFADAGAVIKELFTHAHVTVAKVWADNEDGDRLALDLIADRIRDIIEVPIDGRYPEAETMFKAMAKAKTARNQELNRILNSTE